MTGRRDKRGRRIGRNWWREFVTALVQDHNDAVDRLDGFNHQMEPDEFRAAHPYITLKQCLTEHRGMTPLL